MVKLLTTAPKKQELNSQHPLQVSAEPGQHFELIPPTPSLQHYSWEKANQTNKKGKYLEAEKDYVLPKVDWPLKKDFPKSFF